MLKQLKELPALTAGEKQVLDALFIANESQLSFLAEEPHPVRKERPLEQGWLLMKDIRRMIGDKRRNLPSMIDQFNRVNFGKNHTEMNFVKLPRYIDGLVRKKLVEKKLQQYKDSKKRTLKLLVYRIAVTPEAWRTVALFYDEKRVFPHFYVSYYARKNLNCVNEWLFNFDKLLDTTTNGPFLNFDNQKNLNTEREKYLWESKKMTITHRPILLPRLFTLYLQNPAECEEELNKIGELKNIEGVTHWEINSIISAGEAYYEGKYFLVGSSIERANEKAVLDFLGMVKESKILDKSSVSKLYKVIHDYKGPFFRETLRVNRDPKWKPNIINDTQAINKHRLKTSEVNGKRKKAGGS